MNTPTLDQVFRDAQQLLPEEQRALVMLIEPPKSLEEIAADQGVGPFDFKAVQAEAEGIWPEDESADEFIAAVQEWRQEGRQRELD